MDCSFLERCYRFCDRLNYAHLLVAHKTRKEILVEKLKENDLRVEADYRSESINKKVRDAQVAKVNYILVIGEQEVKAKTINIRTRDGKVIGAKKPEEFIKKVLKENDGKMNESVFK